ncbi:PriCT-2 domain-containing protein [bacterium]|nr:PriCT-2 domain-containing protein [bacterium]
METRNKKLFSNEEIALLRKNAGFEESEKPSFQPDINDAVHFLRALGRAEDVSDVTFTFQVFDDTEERDHSKAKHFSGTLKEAWGKLLESNKDGCGVFVMINEGDQLGRSEPNVVKVRALFIDLDGSPIEPVTNSSTPPHIVVESSKDRFHAYWLVDDCPLESFRTLQKALIKKFNGDSRVCDLPRVMRLPGFFHRKTSNPIMTRLVSTDQSRAPYQIDTLVKELQLELDPNHITSSTKSNAAVPVEQIEEMLAYIDPDSDYDTWMKVGLAIHSEYPNESGFKMFDAWSSLGKKYKAQEMRSKWESFSNPYSGKRVTMKTLRKFAKDGGFEKKQKKEERSAKEYIDFIYSLPQVKEIKREFFSDELIVFTNDGKKYPIANLLKYIQSYAIEAGGFTLSYFETHLCRHWLEEKQPELLIDIPEWDGIDRLKEICSCVKAKDFNRDELYQLLRNWGVTIFRRMEDPTIQPYVLILKGAQGVGKDSLLDALVGGFGPYYFELNLNNIAEAERELHTAAVFKITEFDRSAKQSAQVKRIITTNKTTVRLAFDPRPQERFVRASYAATSNVDDIFTDVTGNRRYWVIDLEYGGFRQIATNGNGKITFSKDVEKDYPGMFCRSNFRSERLQILAQFKALAQTGEHRPDQAVQDKMNSIVRALTPDDPYDTLVDVWDENVHDSLSNPMYGSSNDTARSRGYLTNSEIKQRHLIERMIEDTGLCPNQIRQALKKAGRFKRIGKERRYTFELPKGRNELTDDEVNTLDRLMDDDEEYDSFEC